MAKPPLPKDAAPEPLPEFEPPPEGEELEHLLAEIAAYDEAMAGRDAEFAEELACRARSRGIDVSRMLPAIATDRDLLAEADHSIDVGGFAIGPEQGRAGNHRSGQRGLYGHEKG